MSNRKQILFSAGLVLLAGAIVTLYTAMSGRQAAAPAQQGHNHAAMAAAPGPEAQPVQLDERAQQRIGITFAVAEMKSLRRTVQTVGTVAYDETRLANVNPKIEGWVERLYVDFTGAPVRRGQPLMDVYSPMLVSAQEELLLARRLADAAAPEDARAVANANQLLEAARRRLRYWDIPDEEIARIEAAGTPRKTLTLRAPASGVVVEKNVVAGARIMPGMDLYRIADLARVWIEGDVFEKDLSLVHLGQPARVTFEAYPGKTFRGLVTYVYPTVNVDTHTGRIRVELDNPDGRLKPGMYASLNLTDMSDRPALVVPRTAVLFTGERTLVFRRDPNGMLTPQQITAGLAAGDQIEVLSGLKPGDVVVSSASFLVDAESNLGAAMQAMPGMDMSAPGTKAKSPPGDMPGMDMSAPGAKSQPASGDMDMRAPASKAKPPEKVKAQG